MLNIRRDSWLSPVTTLRRLVVCLVLVAATVPAGRSQAENWPGWRGPRGDGSSHETNVPVRWSATENIAWKTDLNYVGHASPVVWENRVFLVGTNLETRDRMLVAYDRTTGEPVWERAVVRTPLERKHRLNSYSSGTPATDGERVYVSFLDGKQMLAAAYDFDGNELWKVRPGAFSSVHGFCSCPVLFEDKLIINGDHDGEAYLVALSREDGSTKWQTPRENKTRSYCTPIIRDIDGRTQMLLSGNKCVASYDPRTGSRHWMMDGPTEQFVASPVYSHNLLFITGGFPEKHLLTIDATGQGDVTKSHVVWHHKGGDMVSYVPSPIAVGDYFLVASDNGFATCLDAKTGKVQWSERLSRHYSASLVSAGGLVYFLDDEGVAKVIKPGPKFDLVATNELPGEFSASPAISQGQILVRSDAALYCIGERK